MRRWTITILLGFVASGFLAYGVAAGTEGPTRKSDVPEKPILLMTPSDLFSNPELRELAVAAQHGNVQKIDALIARGVNVNGKGRYGITSLFSAWQARNKVGFRALLDNGANPNNIWSGGYTLLNEIAASSSPSFLKMALQHGANPNLVEPRSDETPLFPAVEFPEGNVNVPILIKAGGDLNHQSKPLMKTAMMEAAAVGHFRVVYELLIAGANFKLKDKYGRDIRYPIKRSLADYQPLWRHRIIKFLKQHNFWDGSVPPAGDAQPETLSPSGTTTVDSAPNLTTSQRAAFIKRLEKAIKAPGAASAGFGKDIGCVPLSGLDSGDNPMELDLALVKCVSSGRYERAVRIEMLIEAYTTFDSMRVADKTAHGVNSDVLPLIMMSLGHKRLKGFGAAMQRLRNDPESVRSACAGIRRIGPPEYYPTYMVGHGMQMFTGFTTPHGLVSDFDAQDAWKKVIKAPLHCPSAKSHTTMKHSAPSVQTDNSPELKVERKDSLYPTRNLGCRPAKELDNRDTPADLFPGIVKCVKADHYQRAVLMLMMATAYANFDMLRVPDTTTHNVDMVLLDRTKKKLSKEQIKRLGRGLVSTVKSDNKRGKVCAELERIGPPGYYPRYMVQFGIEAVTGFRTPNGIVASFDATRAWRNTLTKDLHCKNLPNERMGQN